MKYMMIVPFTDLADERPRVSTKFFEVASEEEAAVLADQLAADARKLMDLAVCDWRDDEEWKDLDGALLLKEAGYAFGSVEVWNGEQFLHVAETPYGLCDLEPCQGELEPVAPRSPAHPIPPAPIPSACVSAR